MTSVLDLMMSIFKLPLVTTHKVCLCVCPSVCLSVLLYVCPSVCLSVLLYVCLSFCMSVCLSVCLSVFLSFHFACSLVSLYSDLQGDRLVEMFGKFISVALQSHTFDMIPLAKLCQTCHHTFTKDRDKTILARVLVNELVLVLKYKSTLPEANVLTILEVTP